MHVYYENFWELEVQYGCVDWQYEYDKLLHEYGVKLSTSVNNYDIKQVNMVELACTMMKKAN